MAFSFLSLLWYRRLTIYRMIRPMLGWLLAALLLVGILLINARTIFVELVLAMLIVMIASSSGKLRISVRSLRLFAGVTVVLLRISVGSSPDENRV